MRDRLWLDRTLQPMMARTGTVAVPRPEATDAVRRNPQSKSAPMRRAGVRMAIASDMTLGSCRARSLPLMPNLACTLSRTTMPEALLGIHRRDAAALGRRSCIGGNPCVGSIGVGR